MTRSPDVLAAPAAPHQPPTASGDADGFLDCRGEWHAWAEEEGR